MTRLRMVGPEQVTSWLAGEGLAARLAERRGTLPTQRAEAALEAALHAAGAALR